MRMEKEELSPMDKLLKELTECREERDKSREIAEALMDDLSLSVTLVKTLNRELEIASTLHQRIGRVLLQDVNDWERTMDELVKTYNCIYQ